VHKGREKHEVAFRDIYRKTGHEVSSACKMIDMSQEHRFFKEILDASFPCNIWSVPWLAGSLVLLSLTPLTQSAPTWNDLQFQHLYREG
jgi:hypothetical protein